MDESPSVELLEPNRFRVGDLAQGEIPVRAINDVRHFTDFRLVTTKAGGATDYGPYKGIYLVYDNGIEMPWRFATYLIGHTAGVQSVKQTGPATFTIDVGEFRVGDGWDHVFEGRISVDVDASNIMSENSRFEQDPDLEWVEGRIPSHLILRVSPR